MCFCETVRSRSRAASHGPAGARARRDEPHGVHAGGVRGGAPQGARGAPVLGAHDHAHAGTGRLLPAGHRSATRLLTYAMAGGVQGRAQADAVDVVVEQFLARGLRQIGPHERRGQLRVVLHALSHRGPKGTSSSLRHGRVDTNGVGSLSGGARRRFSGGGGGGGVHGIAREQAGRGNSAANVAGPTGDGSKGGASAGTGTRRGEVFEEWRINVVVSESSSFPIQAARFRGPRASARTKRPRKRYARESSSLRGRRRRQRPSFLTVWTAWAHFRTP